MRRFLLPLKEFVENNLQVEKLFLVIFIPFGIGMIFLIPPGWNNDEPAHVLRVLQLADGNLLSEEFSSTGGKIIGGHVSSDVLSFFEATGGLGADVTDPGRKASFIHESENPGLQLHENKDNTQLASFPGSAVYSPVAYFPEIIATWVGRVLSVNLFGIVVLGRLLSLLFVGGALFYAIRIIPVGKWILFTVALLPGFVYQAASFSADGVLFASTLLFAALVLAYALQKKKLTWRQYVCLGSVMAAICLVKVTYAPMLLLLGAIPLFNVAMRSKKELGALLAVFTMAIVPCLVWLYLTRYIDINNPVANYHLQKDLLFAHPAGFLHILYNTYLTNSQPLLYSSLFGNFIWLTAPLPMVYVFGAVAALTLSLFVHDAREVKWHFTKKQLLIFRLGIISIAALCTVLISVALYLYFTKVGQPAVDGIQGRYFLPFLPLLLLAFTGSRIDKQTIPKRTIVIIVIISLLGSLMAIWERLYIAVLS